MHSYNFPLVHYCWRQSQFKPKRTFTDREKAETRQTSLNFNNLRSNQGNCTVANKLVHYLNAG